MSLESVVACFKSLSQVFAWTNWQKVQITLTLFLPTRSFRNANQTPYRSSSPVSIFQLIKGMYLTVCGPGSSVGIASDYGMDGPGSNPGGDENFRPFRPALGPTQPPVQWVPGLSRG